MKKNAAAESFIPFEPASTGAPAPDAAPRLKVVPKPDARPDFNPLSGAPGSAPHPPGAHPQASATPTVSLQRDGDRVTGIRIECSCGQVIELACSY